MGSDSRRLDLQASALQVRLCVHNGITRGIWRVTGWDPDEGKWGIGRRGLEGEPALDLWDEYLGRDASEYLPAQGGQIPYTILA